MIRNHIREVTRDGEGHVVRSESGFVAGTWLRSYLSSPWARRLDRDEYARWHAPMVAGLLDNARVVVAEQDDAPGAFLGHACAEMTDAGPVLHYVYVKGDFRKLGCGRALWERALRDVGWDGKGRVFYSHSRRPFSDVAGRMGWRFSPYPAMRWAKWRTA